MGYLKAFILSAAVALVIIFMVQNIKPLSEPLSIRLDLIFLKFESTPYATYLVIMLAFFVGLLTASLLGMAERFRQRREIKRQAKEIEGLHKELASLRNLPVTAKALDQGQAMAEEEGKII
jgi:uncharacterized integral membrane protein